MFGETKSNVVSPGASNAAAASPCPACEETAAPQFLYAKNGCNILQCRTCGLGRAEAVNFDPSVYYSADYFSGTHPDGYADYLGAETVLGQEFGRTVDFIRRFSSHGRLLELGCAYGFFLQRAKRFFDVSGIEIAEEAASHCRRRGLNVLSCPAEESTLDKLGTMDVIVLLDVIEHLPDPRGTLAACERHLDPGGIVVLTTGDFGSLVARRARSRWRLMTPPQHLWYFTQSSMQRLAGSLGLRVEYLDHPWKLVPLSLILFQLRRILRLGRGRRSAMSGIGIPVNLFDAMRVVLRKPTEHERTTHV